LNKTRKMVRKGMSEFRHIVRIAGIDLDGATGVAYALSRIRGINIPLAYAVLRKVNIKPETRLGFLTETEIEKIESVVRNLVKSDLPIWLRNRRKDLETGRDIHLIGSDLELQIKSDIDRLKTLRSWRGYRHAYGLRVRGQKTRTSGRTGKVMGVKKKAVQA